MDKPHDMPLATLELFNLRTKQHGRVFYPAIFALLEKAPEREEIHQRFERLFVEEDDVERMALLEKALMRRTFEVKAHHGVEGELHVYLDPCGVSPDPLFACVLAPLGVVRQMAYPHIHREIQGVRIDPFVIETASFQAMGEQVTASAIASALDDWAARVWPDETFPELDERCRLSLAVDLEAARLYKIINE